nr:gluconate 2-dehydrogenase subunit 3 family protein [Pedobacter panaciterrae]
MNRRQVIYRILGFSAVAISGTGFWKFWSVYKKPDLLYLTNKKALIAEIAETIIPGTDTPGAKMAKVEDFIIKMVKDCTATKSQNNFIKGLIDLEEYTKQNYHKTYASCSANEKEAILTHFENAEESHHLIHKLKQKVLGENFFYMFKSYTVIGYCTSEPGATKGLSYDYLPSTFEACITIGDKQKSWATK